MGGPGGGDVVEAMRREHAGDVLFWRATGEPAERFDAAQPNSFVSPQAEWNVVVQGGRAGQAVEETLPGCPPGHTPVIRGRETSGMGLCDYLERARSECQGLLTEEVVALRLWTGPMYSRYALLLRSLCVCGTRPASPRPGQARYAATLLALNSAIIKLARRPAARHDVVYRGLRLDPPGVPGEPLDGVEPRLLAFSSDLGVAEEYACRGGRKGFLLVCRTGEAGWPACGADVSWVSQFPDQREVLLPALSHVRSVGAPWRGEAGLWALEVTVEAEGKTLEELAAEQIEAQGEAAYERASAAGEEEHADAF